MMRLVALFLICRCYMMPNSTPYRKDLTLIVVVTVLIFLVLNIPRLLLGIFEMSR